MNDFQFKSLILIESIRVVMVLDIKIDTRKDSRSIYLLKVLSLSCKEFVSTHKNRSSGRGRY